MIGGSVKEYYWETKQTTVSSTSDFQEADYDYIRAAGGDAFGVVSDFLENHPLATLKLMNSVPGI